MMDWLAWINHYYMFHFFDSISLPDVEPCVFCHFAMHNIKETPFKKALNSSLFKAIKCEHPCRENLLRLCMPVDKPEMGRRMALGSRAYFTHPEAVFLFTKLAREMDRFADDYAVLAQEALEKNYQSKEA